MPAPFDKTWPFQTDMDRDNTNVFFHTSSSNYKPGLKEWTTTRHVGITLLVESWLYEEGIPYYWSEYVNPYTFFFKTRRDALRFKLRF